MSEIVELQETISPRPENIPDETPNTDEDANNDANSEEEESHDYPQGIRLLLITLALVLSVFLSALDSTIVATAIPTITNQFGHLDDVTWYSSAYSLTNFAFLSSWGKAYRHFSLKATFLLAGVIFEVGNVICALSKDSTTLIAGRAISGLGGGGIMSGAFIIIALTVRPSRRAAYMGIIGVTFGCAGVVGPVLGGVLTERVSWRWCFWVSLPIWATGATLIFFCLSTARSTESSETDASLLDKLIQLDVTGSLLATASGALFITAMHWGGVSKTWTSLPVVACLTGSAALTVSFVVNEWKMGARAMVQGHLFCKATFVANLVYVFFLAGLYFPLLYSLPIQFQSIDNQSASESGVRLIPLVLGISIFTMVSNALVSVYRTHVPLIVAGALAGTLGVGLIYSLDERASVATWIGTEIVTAVGVGLALQLPMIANQAIVTPADIPEATALTLFFENLGTVLFVAAGEAAFTSRLVSSLADNAPHLDPAAVIRVGATQIRDIFGPADLQGVLRSYLDGCQVNHAVSLACGGVTTLVSLVMTVPVMRKHLGIWMQKPHVP